MARTGSGCAPLLLRRNVKLDSFLKRNTCQALYERIRTCEPCVVVSETVSKVYMHVVLTDERLYLTEYAPRTLTAAASFARVRDIKLVNDLPDFLSGKDREHCQHIRIIYVTQKPAGKGRDRLSRNKKDGPAPAALSSRRTSYCPSDTSDGHPAQRSHGERRKERLSKPIRSASCPNPETLGLVRVPRPPTQPLPTAPTSPPSPSHQTRERSQGPRTVGSVLSRLMQKDSGKNEGEAELHLYAVSQKSRLYLHLQSLWTSFMIRSTLLLDPLYCDSSLSDSAAGRRRPAVSWDRTAHLFTQLSSELLQDGVGVQSLYLLLQELRTASRHSITLRRLFWRSSEVCVFLVQTLEESLHGCQSLGGVYTADQLLLSTMIVQTLAVMFRETEVEAARVNQLSAKKGALASRMLLALICDPHLEAHTQGSPPPSQLQALLSKYLDAACSLLFELLLIGEETSRCCSAGSILSVGWILQALQPHPHLLSFVGYQAKQVALALSDLQESVLSPLQAVVLFQRCRLLLACLQYSSQLAQHLRSHFREEFRYFVKPSCVQEKLPPCYPISQPTVQLVAHILTLMLQE